MPHNLPPRRLFVGRRDELRLVDEALAREGRSSIAGAAVFGLGGVGKTSLALEYAHRALDAGTYPGGIFWVAADGRPLDVLAQLAGILREVAPGLLPDMPAQASSVEVAKIVRRTLEGLPAPSLLVLDDVSERWGAALLPGGQARVLMTLRDRRLRVGKPIALEVLSHEDACMLAIELAEKKPENEAEEAALGRVVDGQLGGLAGAVEVAAREVRDRARSWIAYEESLATRPKDALDADEPGVFAAIDLSIDRCGKSSRGLLEGAAVFAPEGVPLDWAYAAAGLSAEDVRARRARRELVALRLVKVDEQAGTLSMQRLVHKRVRERVEPEAWERACRGAMKGVQSWIMKAVGPAQEQMDAVEARRGHVVAALATAEGAKNGAVTEWLAIHLWHHGEYAEARSLWERRLPAAEQTYGPEHPTMATRLSNMAAVLRSMGEHAQALVLEERSLAIIEKTQGPEHPKVAARLSNIAVSYVGLRRLSVARALMERALAIDESTCGPDDPKVAIDLAILANVLREVGKEAEALPLARRALAIDEKAYGPVHPYVAMRLHAVARALLNLGDAVEARPLVERAVAIAEKALPAGHPDVALYRSSLAAVREALGTGPPGEG